MNGSVGLEAFFHAAAVRAALGIEALAVAVIVLAIAFGTIRFLVRLTTQPLDAYQSYKSRLAKALLLGLEFLIAADIVRTVAQEATLHNVAVLGAIVLVRTFLSWSLVVEAEGRWPWEKPVSTTRSVGAAEIKEAA